MYSQNQEESFIIDHFKNLKEGRFLDIGAYDGKKFSNTYRLFELGWTGVCIEPSPSAFRGLLSNYSGKTEVKLVNAAVSKDSKIIKFYDANGDAISSSNDNHVNKWRSGGSKFTEIWIKTITVKEIFDLFGKDYNFINLDVEALNLEIFKEIDFSTLPKLSLFCIEHDNSINFITTHMKQFGFYTLHCNGENLILYR